MKLPERTKPNTITEFASFLLRIRFYIRFEWFENIIVLENETGYSLQLEGCYDCVPISLCLCLSFCDLIWFSFSFCPFWHIALLEMYNLCFMFIERTFSFYNL